MNTIGFAEEKKPVKVDMGAVGKIDSFMVRMNALAIIFLSLAVLVAGFGLGVIYGHHQFASHGVTIQTTSDWFDNKETIVVYTNVCKEISFAVKK